MHAEIVVDGGPADQSSLREWLSREPDVRSHLADDHRPEVFHVNLEAIVLKRDERTNVRLLPFDQVYVGETRQAVVERVVPPWFRPLYRTLTNTRLPRSADGGEAPKPSQWVAGSRQPAAGSAD